MSYKYLWIVRNHNQRYTLKKTQYENKLYTTGCKIINAPRIMPIDLLELEHHRVYYR